MLQKVGGERTVITCDRVTFLALALCTLSDSRVSMYKVSCNSLLLFQRYAPGKLFIANIKKGSYSVNSGDRVTVLPFCYFFNGPLSVYQVS